MRRTIDITLAGRVFAIRPLTLGQVAAIDDAVGRTLGAVAQGIAIVEAGLMRDHSEITAAVLREQEITPAELAAATSAVLAQGGFLPEGEAPAAAGANASTGEPSAAA